MPWLQHDPKVGQCRGILSADPGHNPAYHDWNHVLLWYCTSDSHLGDADSGSQETGPFQYRGKRVVAAMVRQLLDKHELGNATDLLLTGDSAGGVACMNNAGFIRQLLADRTPRLMRYKAFVDAGWFLDIPSYSPDASAFTFRMNAQALERRWNATYDADCVAAWPGEAWRCFHAQYAWPHLTTPMLFHQYLYDSANLGFDQAGTEQDWEDFRQHMVAALMPPPPPCQHLLRPQEQASDSSGAARQAACQQKQVDGEATWQPNTRRTLTASAELGPAIAAGVPAPQVFAPACALHEIEDDTLFTTSRIGQQAFASVLADWFAGRRQAVRMVDLLHPGARSQAECQGQASL